MASLPILWFTEFNRPVPERVLKSLLLISGRKVLFCYEKQVGLEALLISWFLAA